MHRKQVVKSRVLLAESDWQKGIIMEKKDKTKTGQVWVMYDDVLAEDMPTWTKRRILAHGQEMMMVENEFAPEDTAPEHQHPHSQITYVISGALEFTVDGETKVLRKGDSVYIAPHATHSALATEDTLVIDMFAPMREDFLE